MAKWLLSMFSPGAFKLSPLVVIVGSSVVSAIVYLFIRRNLPGARARALTDKSLVDLSNGPINIDDEGHDTVDVVDVVGNGEDNSAPGSVSEEVVMSFISVSTDSENGKEVVSTIGIGEVSQTELELENENEDGPVTTNTVNDVETKKDEGEKVVLAIGKDLENEKIQAILVIGEIIRMALAEHTGGCDLETTARLLREGGGMKAIGIDGTMEGDEIAFVYGFSDLGSFLESELMKNYICVTKYDGKPTLYVAKSKECLGQSSSLDIVELISEKGFLKNSTEDKSGSEGATNRNCEREGASCSSSNWMGEKQIGAIGSGDGDTVKGIGTTSSAPNVGRAGDGGLLFCVTERYLVIPRDRSEALFRNDGALVRQIGASFGINLISLYHSVEECDKDAHYVDLSGQRVDIDSFPAIDSFVILGIGGPSVEQVDGALRELRKMLLDEPTCFESILRVPQGAIGSIIGKSGSSIKELTELHNVRIHVSREPGELREVKITGTNRANVDKATEAVMAKVNSVREYNRRGGGRFSRSFQTW